MKRLSATLLLAALAGCATPSDATHWNRGQDLLRSTQFHFLGWNPGSGQSYGAYISDSAGHIGKTLRRHFWSSNPDNPRLGTLGTENHAGEDMPPPPSEFRVSDND